MNRAKRFLESKLGLSIGDIGPIALSLGVAVIIISVVSLVLGTMSPQTYTEVSIEDEDAGTLNTDDTYTVDEASEDDFVELESAQFYDSDSSELETNITDAEDGEVTLEESDLTDEDVTIDYTYDEESTATGIFDKGLDAMSVFGDWFNIIVIVAIAAIILGLVMLFRGKTGGGV